MKPELIVAWILIALAGAGLIGLFLFSPASTGGAKNGEGKTVPYTEIAGPTGFVNTDGITLKELIGKKVVIVDFMTYTCINCQRTFPYLNAWYEKYKDDGLEIVGIHTPEFAFEKDIDNVRGAMRGFDIAFPVVLDNNYATWNAYGNRYWPRKYIIDIHGNVVYDHIGEGGYEETEAKIKELLKERAEVLGVSAGDADGTELAADSVSGATIETASPETYFGSARNEYLGNGVSGLSGERSFEEPQTVKPNTLYLIGRWDIESEYAETASSVGSPETGSARIDYLFTAKGAYLVMGSANPAEVEVLLDSGPVPESMKGSDVYYRNGRSYVKVQEDRLYRLIDAPSAGKHFLELVIPRAGLKAFAFTFG
jgi:thiol-disulfide isomerase/thioredoxin